MRQFEDRRDAMAARRKIEQREDYPASNRNAIAPNYEHYCRTGEMRYRLDDGRLVTREEANG